MFLANNYNIKSSYTVDEIFFSSTWLQVLFEPSDNIFKLKGHAHHKSFFDGLNIQEIFNWCGSTFFLEWLVNLSHILKSIIKIGRLFTFKCFLGNNDKEVKTLLK